MEEYVHEQLKKRTSEYDEAEVNVKYRVVMSMIRCLAEDEGFDRQKLKFDIEHFLNVLTGISLCDFLIHIFRYAEMKGDQKTKNACGTLFATYYETIKHFC